MSRVVHFVIPGRPVGKGSVRVNGHATTDPATRNYMRRARAEYQKQVGYTFPDKVPLEIVIVAYYQVQTSRSKKERALCISGEIVPIVKPDFDNIAKVVCDSLQPDRSKKHPMKGPAAFNDDSRVVIGTVVKRYSEDPRVEVFIREWEKGGTKLWWE